MSKAIVTDVVTLEGYQNAFKPSQFGKCGVQAIIGQDIIDQLEEERPEKLEWAKGKMKNPKRATCKIEPWEEIKDGQYQVKFSWKPESPVPIVDSEGTPIAKEIPLYSGSKVKLAFYQKPYTMPDAFGTRLVLQGIQVISCSGNAGVDYGDLGSDEVASLFGSTKGFKYEEPNVTPTADEEDDDF